MLIERVVTTRPNKLIDTLVRSVGMYKGMHIQMTQGYSKGVLMERLMQIDGKNFQRNQVKIRNKEGGFSKWG